MNLNNNVSAFFHKATEILDRPWHGYQNKILENFEIKKPVDSYKNIHLQRTAKIIQIALIIIFSPAILMVLIFLSFLSTITRALANDILISRLFTKIFKIKPKTPFTHLKKVKQWKKPFQKTKKFPYLAPMYAL